MTPHPFFIRYLLFDSPNIVCHHLLLGTASDSKSDPGSCDAKHIGTYYIRAGGMEGIPNELWRQLTTLIGATDGDSDDDGDGDRVVESRIDIDVDHKKNSEVESAVLDNQKHSIPNANVEECSLERVPSSSDSPDELEHTNQGGDAGPEDDDEVEDEIEEAVEIGLEECAMLRDSLQRKLDALISTQDRFVP